jgi:hypothetical protein
MRLAFLGWVPLQQELIPVGVICLHY